MGHTRKVVVQGESIAFMPGFLVWMLIVILTLLNTERLYSQDYPARPIRLVTGGVGGAGDFTARLIANKIPAAIGQQVIVDNRASGVIPGEVVSRAAADGYTLLVASGALWIGPLIQKTPYDPVRDFAPISLINSAPNIVVVHPSLPVKSIRELISLAKANAGKLNYASGPTGASNHVAPELFKSMAAIDIVRVVYKSGAAALTDLISGQVQLTFGTASGTGPYVKSGRLRALAVTSATPSVLFPGLPTVAASLPGYESTTLNGLFAPARTPVAIITRLNREIARFLHDDDVKEKFLAFGVEVVGGSPEEFAKLINTDIGKMKKVIGGAGISGE